MRPTSSKTGNTAILFPKEFNDSREGIPGRSPNMNNKRFRIPILPGFAAVSALMWTGLIFAQELPSRNAGTTIHVDVDFVLLNATVTDEVGRSVNGLQQKNFHLWEDKVEQQIEYLAEE